MDIRRYSGVFCLGISLLAAYTFLNFCLLIGSGGEPKWIIPAETPMPWYLLDGADSRIAGLSLTEKREARTGSRKAYSLYIGMSTARDGIDPVVVDAEDRLDVRYAGIAGSGTGFTKLLMLSESLESSDIAPDYVIVCTSPAFLTGRDEPDRPDPQKLPAPQAGIRGAVRFLRKVVWRSLCWPVNNQKYFTNWKRSSVRESRLALFRLFRIPFEFFCPPDVNPWEPPARLGYKEHRDQGDLDFQLKAIKEYGWFDPGKYQKNRDVQIQALERLVSNLRRRNCRVAIVFMPQNSTMNALVPAEAASFVMSRLNRAFTAPPVPIFNGERLMPDGMFSDYVHLNVLGRRRFSSLLGKWLGEHLYAAP